MHMCMLFPWSRISPNMEGLLTEMRIAMYMWILFPWPPISLTWRVLQREMRIAMPECVYYSFDHLFSPHGGGCWEKWELQCLYVYIIPLITYFPNMEGVAHRNENCNVCICILFLWSPIFPSRRGMLRELRIAMYVFVYYSLDHIFPKHGGGCSQKWELQCLYVHIIPLITYFPKHVGGSSHKRELHCICVCYSFGHVFPQTWWGCSQKWELQCIFVYYSLDHLFPQHGECCREKWELQCLCVYIIPLITYFPNMEGVAHRDENCNVCMCILLLWSPIFPSWRGMLREMRIAMSVCVYYSLDHLFPQTWRDCSQKWELQCICVYYSLDHLFPQHGGCCREKWELQCLCVYIIPLITYFPNMEGVAHRNENCNACMCILFLWSPIFPSWRGVLREMGIAMSVCVYYYVDHLFPQHRVGCSPKWELHCLYMYIIPLVTYFPKHGGGCSQKWELQCLYVYIIPLITYFHKHVGGCSHKRELQCICVCNSLGHVFPQTWRGCSQKWELQCICVYYSLDHLFPQHGGCCREKWELQCLCVHIIPLITYFHNMEGVAHRNENFIVCICILFLWSPISPTWKGFLTEMRIAMSARVYYSLDHLFPHHGRGWAHKWELQCLYVYFITLDHLFPNMEGVAHRNENCNVCIWILFLWSPFFPSRRGMLREIGIAMYVFVYYSLDHIFPKHGGGCSQKWELQCLYVYIIPLITYFPKHVGVAHMKENCNVYVYIIPLTTYFPKHGGCCREKWELQCLCVYIIPLITYFPKHGGGCSQKWELQCCMCILFPWSPISPNMEGLLTEMRIAMYMCIYSLDHLFPQHEGVAERNENCNVCVCILFPWSHIFQTWRGLLTEMRIAMPVCVYYSFDHLFSHHGGGCWEKWELQCLYVYIITLITYFPNIEWVAHWNENCIVCICILFPWSRISPNMEGVAHRNENCNVCMCILFPWSPISTNM